MSMGIIYYGINFAIEELHPTEDVLISITLVALVEIPAYLVNAFLMDIIGRKPIILLSMLVAAVACLVSLIRHINDWVFIGSLLVLKSTVAGVFTLIRIYTIELYPRVLKGKAFGLCKALASFAAIFSPLMTLTPLRIKQAVMISFLSISLGLIVITGILFIFLPDTIGFSGLRDMEDIQFMMENSKPYDELDWDGWSPPSSAKKEEK